MIGRPTDGDGRGGRRLRRPARQGLTEEELRHFCRERLTGYKMPREFLFRDELPKSNVGKVLRRNLRESFAH